MTDDSLDFQDKAPDLERVEDETSSTALAESPDAPPAAHAGAAANAVADAEAGACLDDTPGIEPIIDTPPPGEAPKKGA